MIPAYGAAQQHAAAPATPGCRIGIQNLSSAIFLHFLRLFYSLFTHRLCSSSRSESTPALLQTAKAEITPDHLLVSTPPPP